MIVRPLAALAVAVLALGGGLLPAPAHAFPWDECTTNANCPQAKPTCTTRFLVIKQCVNICNTDSQCLPNFACLRGTCTSPVKPAPPPAPPKGRPAGQATLCNPADGSRPHGAAVVDANGKPVGACPAGTVCTSTGFCARPEQ